MKTQQITLVDVADGEFMLRKLEGRRVTVRQIEREFKLPRLALATYRANNYGRRVKAASNYILKKHYAKSECLHTRIRS